MKIKLKYVASKYTNGVITIDLGLMGCGKHF
jgi:hypothetical protein